MAAAVEFHLVRWNVHGSLVGDRFRKFPQPGLDAGRNAAVLGVYYLQPKFGCQFKRGQELRRGGCSRGDHILTVVPGKA